MTVLHRPALDRALTVTSTEPGRALVDLDPTWASWAGPHGGLVAGLLVQAAAPLSGGRAPRSVTAHFLTAAPLGEVELTSRLVREGGSSCVVATELLDGDGAPCVTAVVTSGRARPAGTAYDAVPAPVVEGPEGVAVLEPPVEFVPFAQHVEFRPVEGSLLTGSGPARLTAWVRPRDGGTLDAAALVLLCDVLPPALYGATSDPVPIPTVELGITLTGARTDDEWVLTRIVTRTAGDGWCVDDSEVWRSDGVLLASGRQTRRVLGSL